MRLKFNTRTKSFLRCFLSFHITKWGTKIWYATSWCICTTNLSHNICFEYFSRSNIKSLNEARWRQLFTNLAFSGLRKIHHKDPSDCFDQGFLGNAMLAPMKNVEAYYWGDLDLFLYPKTIPFFSNFSTKKKNADSFNLYITRTQHNIHCSNCLSVYFTKWKKV